MFKPKLGPTLEEMVKEPSLWERFEKAYERAKQRENLIKEIDEREYNIIKSEMYNRQSKSQ